MAFIGLGRDSFENVRIALTPTVSFVSSSTEGITGSQHIASIKSKRIKEIQTFEINKSNLPQYYDSNTNPAYDEKDYAIVTLTKEMKNIHDAFGGSSTSFFNRYFAAVSDAPLSVKYNKSLPIQRIEQPVNFSTGTIAKRNIQKILMPYYQHSYSDCGFYYRNYHTLNFFTGSNFDKNAVLLYPNVDDKYTFSDSSRIKSNFTLQFWINPRYKNDNEFIDFKAGTIFHMSSSIAVSLISGSKKDAKGKVDSYKILLQGKNTADISPHKINFNSRSYPNDLWATSSFELSHNHWHHVTIRWGSNYNNATGSIVIDDNSTEFLFPSSSIFTPNMNAIAIGNHYQGNKDNLALFFNDTTNTNEGIRSFGGANDPDGSEYSFNNPLNAEIHEIKLYNKYLNDEQLKLTGSGVSLDDIEENNLKFYLPPYYSPTNKKQQFMYDGTFKVITSSNAPVNSLFSFSKNGREINLQNFTKDFITNYHPRLFNLTSSVTNQYDDVQSFMFDKNSNAKRNLTILPNDNGLFAPNYYVVEKFATGSQKKIFTGGHLGNNYNYDLIKIEKFLDKGFDNYNHTVLSNTFSAEISGDIQADVLSQGPVDVDIQSKIILNIENNQYFPLSLAEDINDDSSNHISIFNISNLYYGNRINPGSFNVVDESLTGSLGKISINLRDDAKGGLYRSDCLTKQAKWNTVGNIFYDEGLVIIKNPHLQFFGKDKFSMNFKGEQNIHSMVINVPVEKSLLNKSNNTTYVAHPKSQNANDENTETIAITAVNIHDEDFNIIMRANLAQPILKDSSDEFILRLKMDF